MSNFLLTLDEDYDFTLLGICCHTKDYRLCWEINNVLKIDLVRGEDLEMNDKGSICSHSFYHFIDEDNHLEYYCISNRGTNGFLVFEQKKVNFYFIIKGYDHNKYTSEIICKIRSLSLVLTSFSINPNQLKSKQNLLF